MYITPNTVSSKKYRLFQEGERARLNLPSSCIERTFWFSSHGDEAGIYAIYEQTNPRWCTMMCKIEPVYKVVKSRKMRSLTRRVDFIFGFCIKSWSRTHAFSSVDHHRMMLSCYRDDSCRVGSELFEIELRFLSRGRPAGLFSKQGRPHGKATPPKNQTQDHRTRELRCANRSQYQN